jgi:hypothetical protein
MKRALFILTIAQCLMAMSSQAARASFDEKGYPFYSKKIEFVWTAPTNQLPATLRVFKPVPSKFSANVISNLIRLSGFTDQDRTFKTYTGEKFSKDVLAFRSQDERSSLTIAPGGFVNLYNPDLSDFKKPLEKVPDQKRAYELGLSILQQLEIPTNQLITKEDGQLKAWFYPGTRGCFDKTKGEFVTEPNVMGVEFRRKVDGIYRIRQHIHIQFENQEKITQLELHWADLQPVNTWPIASPEQIISWIKEGRARAQSLEGPMEARWINVADIKKVTIQEVTIYYDAGDDEEASHYFYPYATLKAEAELSADDKETIWLFSPIIKDGLSRIAKKSDGFSVYPSTLREKQRQKEGGP